MFLAAFRVRGGEFGNWLGARERQRVLNLSYDALCDLAGILGIPTTGIGLNGQLSLAFGSRGQGGARHVAAHYERERRVINLTRASGAGALCHEWWHAFDHHLASLAGVENGFASEMKGSSDPRVASLTRALARLLSGGQGISFFEKASELDRFRRKPYFSSMCELSARAFEAAVANRLAASSRRNDYLVFGADDPRTYDTLAASFPEWVFAEIKTLVGTLIM
jgi:hypothetical protein